MTAHRIGFAGDVMLGRGVDRHQRRRRVDAVWGDVRPLLCDLDGLVVNLECVLSTRGDPWPGRPFHFRADPEWAVPALLDVGVDVAALANNHSMDFGVPGLEDTLDALDDAGIARVGADRTAAEARSHVAVAVPADGAAGEEPGLDLAVVSFTDNTPEYAAGPDSPGTAHVAFDLSVRETRTVVVEALEEAQVTDPDLLVASLHWGPNMVADPPGKFREFGRWLVERGVDVVHGHSAHVFQGVEVHEGRPILYDCGDFVDDYVVDDTLRNDRSFLFELVVADGEPSELRLTPVEISDYAVHRATGDAAEWCRTRMRQRSSDFDTAFERDGEGLVVPLGE